MKLTDALLLALDTETTGPDPSQDRIVEVGGAYLLAGRPHGAPLKTRVNPGMYIPAGATNVHGVRNEDVEHAPGWETVNAWVHDHVCDPRVVVIGYNIIGFDVRVIDNENARVGADWRMPPCLDPYIFANWHHREQRSRKLSIVLDDLYGIVLPENKAHHADADALAVGLLLLRMIEAGVVPNDYVEAFRTQIALQHRLDAEYARYGRVLYEDRDTGALHVGLGRHCGTPLEDADEDYLRRLLGRGDLTDEARHLLNKQLGQAEQMGLF